MLLVIGQWLVYFVFTVGFVWVVMSCLTIGYCDLVDLLFTFDLVWAFWTLMFGFCLLFVVCIADLFVFGLGVSSFCLFDWIAFAGLICYVSICVVICGCWGLAVLVICWRSVCCTTVSLMMEF